MVRTSRILFGVASLVGLLAASIFVTASVAQAATTGATGNAKAIAFYRLMVKTIARYDGLLQSRSGYAVVETTSTGTGWTYGSHAAVVPTGFSPATEVVTDALSGGKVLWVADLMTPKCGAAGSCGTNVPARGILNTQGLYVQVLAPSKPPSCWERIPGDTGAVAGYTKLGGPVYETNGHFDPIKRVGKNELVTSTFPWTKTSTATEIDTISLATHLPTYGVVYAPKDGAAPAFAYAWTNSWMKSAPVQPQMTMCS